MCRVLASPEGQNAPPAALTSASVSVPMLQRRAPETSRLAPCLQHTDLHCTWEDSDARRLRPVGKPVWPAAQA
eukprot:4363168-Alexandrium_andersonii.AAC.1